MRRFIFLDVDGVLNDHRRHPNGYCGIMPECVYRLNRLATTTGAALVISSAWRYLIAPESMTVLGFRHMLVSCGLDPKIEVVGRTVSDEERPCRGCQINFWLRSNFPGLRVISYVILDDGGDIRSGDPDNLTLTDELRTHHPFNLVLVDGTKGIIDADVDRAFEILVREYP